MAKYDTYLIEQILREYAEDTDWMRSLVDEINSWDGTFDDTPITYWEMDNLPNMFEYGYFRKEAMLDMFEAARSGEFNAADKYFFYDSCGCGWESTNEPSFEGYYGDIAEWLCENYDTTAFPSYLENEPELINAIRKALENSEEGY